MLKRLSPRERFDLLVAQFEPALRQAFAVAIADLRDNVEVKLFLDRLERQDVDGAIAALHLDPAAFRPVDRAILTAFEGGGVAAIERMPTLRDPTGGKVMVRFDVRAPRAEAYARMRAGQLVTDLIEGQKQAVRSLITQALAAGQGPNSLARSIIGVRNRATGARTGGVVGLSGPQAQYLEAARQELLSGDPSLLRSYLQRARRDRRFDRSVAKAIRGEGKLDAATVQNMLTRYSDRLLQLRGETIARTETMTALHAGKEEAFRQAIDTGAVQSTQVQKVWFAVRDKNSRDTHAAAEGERVGLEQRFSNGLLYPHAPDAPPSECINCRCSYEIVIDFLAGIGRDF
jgi:hypothetical protein